MSGTRTVDGLLDHVNELRQQLADMRDAAEAYRELSVWWKVGGQPPAALIGRLNKARKTMETR